MKALGLSSSGQPKEALALLEAVVPDYPELISAALLLADLYRGEGRNDRALESYLQILKKDPDHRVARQQGAWIQVKGGLPDAALELLGTTCPKSVNELLIEGYRRLVEEDWAGALQQFQEAEKQIPLDTDLLQLIGTCWSALGKEREALNYLAKASAIRPTDHRIQDQIWQVKEAAALQLMQQEKWSDAVAAFQELLDGRGLRSGDLFRLAYSHQQLGQLTQAIARYRAGFASHPGSEWARTNLASCLYRSAHYREAAQEWERLLKSGKRAERYLQLGLCYSHLSRTAEAASAFSKALDLKPGNPAFLYNLGIARLRQKRTQEAWSLIRRSAASGYGPARRLLAQARNGQ